MGRAASWPARTSFRIGSAAEKPTPSPDITKHSSALMESADRVGSSKTLRRLQQASIRRRMVMFFCGMASG
jgi:hypothetical protein